LAGNFFDVLFPEPPLGATPFFGHDDGGLEHEPLLQQKTEAFLS
jgi:hypothetical protein